MFKLDGDPPNFVALKTGRSLEFERDPHPNATGYLVVEGPELLVLFPRHEQPLQR